MYNALAKSLKNQTNLMFFNLHVSMKTCDWRSDICGAPTWRYIYHTIHSCDKYFINPTIYEEPPFHVTGIDWPDHPSDIVFSKEQISDYLAFVREKVLAYLDGLTDEQLHELPDGCVSSRLELILSQYRHMYAHIGIINGVTIARTGRYPRVVNESNWRSGKKLDDLFDDDIRSIT